MNEILTGFLKNSRVKTIVAKICTVLLRLELYEENESIILLYFQK